MSELPPDPFELSPEDIEQRIAGKPEPLRSQLESMLQWVPRSRVTLDALAAMPSFPALYMAVQALDEDELRDALLNYLHQYHRWRLTPEDYDEWSVSPELRPDDE